jgi:enoyl-CoA hydratase/carnithine racemase
MYKEVTAALREADRDEAVGAVVLTGRGNAFTSGADLVEMAAIASGATVEGSGEGFQGLLDALGTTAVPILAAVNGVAVGLGFTVLAHCDLVLVDQGARLRVPFAELGVPPEAASSLLFPAAMGWQEAARVLLTSDWVNAPELVRLGLALRQCPEGTVLDETVALAMRIAEHPRGATRAITSLMRAARRDAVEQANRREQAAFSSLLRTAVGSGTLAEFAGKPPPAR